MIIKKTSTLIAVIIILCISASKAYAVENPEPVASSGIIEPQPEAQKSRDYKPAYEADDISVVIESQSNSLGLNELKSTLPGTGAEVMADIDITQGIDINTGLTRIYEKGRDEIGGIFKKAIRSAVIILMIAIFCNVAETFFESSSGGAPNYIALAGVLAISIVAVGDVNTFMGLGNNTLEELNNFSKVLLPTLSAAAAASGAITSAAVKLGATALFMDVLITLASGVLMPVIFAYIAASIAEAAIGGEGLTGASSFLKWLATSILTLLVLAFVVYISVIGIVSSTADAAAIRVAKTTLSTVFPVVGSIVSDAASSVLAGASVLKNAVGVFGMLAVISVCLLPFLNLGAHYILYKAVSKISATISSSRISKLISSIGTAFGLVMSLTGACALMLFFSLISLIKVVTPG